MENLDEGPIIDDTQLWQNVKKAISIIIDM